VRRVHQTTVEAFGHQDLPFDRLVEALNPARDARSTLLFNIKCVLQNAPAPRLVLPELTLAPLLTDTGAAKFDLLFNLEDVGGEIAGRLEYNADRFAATTAASLLRDFDAVARAVAADREMRVVGLETQLQAAARETAAGKLLELQRQVALPGARRRATPAAETSGG
jgi:non-ribosomal peptide synthetase component F